MINEMKVGVMLWGSALGWLEKVQQRWFGENDVAEERGIDWS